MASKRFEKETPEWGMFQDFWRLTQEFYIPEEEDRYWAELVKEADAFMERNKEIPLAKELALALTKVLGGAIGRRRITIEEYQKLAIRTVQPGSLTLKNIGLELAGGLSEAADLIKKNMRQDYQLDKQKLVNEFGDVVWSIAMGCTAAGISMNKVFTNKLRRQYLNGFDSEHSVNRKE